VTDQSFLGEFEQLVLWAVARLGEEGYGMTIRREIEERTGRSVSIGAVYTTLDRLERKGHVRSRVGEPTAERGGRARRHFELRESGARALREARAVLTSMWQDVQLGPARDHR
jgi:DNA-binding PadR family transcriptional regulator